MMVDLEVGCTHGWPISEFEHEFLKQKNAISPRGSPMYVCMYVMYVMLCYVMPCHVMPCHAMSCHAMSCHVMYVCMHACMYVCMLCILCFGM